MGRKKGKTQMKRRGGSQRGLEGGWMVREAGGWGGRGERGEERREKAE